MVSAALVSLFGDNARPRSVVEVKVSVSLGELGVGAGTLQLGLADAITAKTRNRWLGNMWMRRTEPKRWQTFETRISLQTCTTSG